MVLILTLIISFATAFACEFNLPHSFIVFNDNGVDQNIMNSKDCGEDAISDLTKLISSFDGRVASFQIQEMMSSKGHRVSINPQSLQVQQFKTILRDQLILPQGIHLKNAQLQNLKNSLVLNPGDQIEVSCTSCLYGNRQPLNLTIKGFDGVNNSFVVSADFVKMVKAFKLLTPMNAFAGFENSEHIQEVLTEAIPHTDFILNKNDLKFYKTNKPLKAGELVRQSDLTAINLVRAGLKTEVIIENKMIRIKTQGISRQNGSIGEFVEVYQPQKNKKYQGKVIDNNKIMVEL